MRIRTTRWTHLLSTLCGLFILVLCIEHVLIPADVAAVRLRAEPNLHAPALAVAVDVQAPAVPVEEDPVTPSEETLAVINSTVQNLSVRAGAGTSFESLGTVTANQTFPVLSWQGNWCHIRYENQDAYLAMGYITLMTREEYDNYNTPVSTEPSGKPIPEQGSTPAPLPEQDSETSTEITPQETLFAKVTAEGNLLNVRAGAGTDFAILGKVGAGEFLPVLAFQGNWCKITYQNKSGYVSLDYVSMVTQNDYEDYLAELERDMNLDGDLGSQIAQYAQKYLGRPYVYGGNGPNSFDCSGFVKYVYAQFGYPLNRTATDQLQNGTVVALDKVVPGDLVFFRSSGTVKPVSHVGLYIGNGQFVHASTNNYQVRIDNLFTGYYKNIYVYARHII